MVCAASLAPSADHEVAKRPVNSPELIGSSV